MIVRCRKREVRPCVTRNAAYVFTIGSTRIVRDRSRPKPHGRRIALVHAYEPIAWVLIPQVTGHGSSESVAPEVRGNKKFDHVPYLRVSDIALCRSDQGESRRGVRDARQIDIGIIVPYLLRRVRKTPSIRHGRNPRPHLTAVLLQKWSKSRIVRPIDPKDIEVRNVHLRHLTTFRRHFGRISPKRPAQLFESPTVRCHTGADAITY